MNYSAKLNLTKLGAFIRNIQGRTKSQDCVIIPTAGCLGLFVSDNGNIYLDLSAIEIREPKYDDTHCIKPDVPKEIRALMSEEELKAVPIIGGLRPIKPKSATAPGEPLDCSKTTDNPDEDFPF